MGLELHVFDFDGTLFKSPHQPKWWPRKGWWGLTASLYPPCVPEKPSSKWWVGSTVSAAKRSISNSDVWAVLMTGRIEGRFRFRVSQLLKQRGLNFDDVYLNPGGTTSTVKKKYIFQLLNRHPDIDAVHIWEDRHMSVYVSFIKKYAKATGRSIEVFPHNVKDHPYPTACSEESYLEFQEHHKAATLKRVTARYLLAQRKVS
jgi:hypothetical protein